MPSILITGASSGFGKNVALSLAKAGWDVYATMRNVSKGEALRSEATASQCSDNLSLIELDVNDAASVGSAVETVLARTEGTLDVLFANAGYSAMGSFEDLSDEDCRRQMDTNFFGALAVARAVIPVMREAGHGRIVVVSSNAVNTPHPMLSIYAASKWAIEGWAEAVAMELAPFGVEVKVVQPGAHRTPFAEHVIPVIPAHSAYKRWMDQAMPGVSNLDRWGRDADKATETIVGAIADPAAPFHTKVGEDAIVFNALKGMVPFETRAWAARAIAGLPGSDAFVESKRTPLSEQSVLDQVLGRLGEAAASDSSGFAAVAAALVSKTKA